MSNYFPTVYPKPTIASGSPFERPFFWGSCTGVQAFREDPISHSGNARRFPQCGSVADGTPFMGLFSRGIKDLGHKATSGVRFVCSSCGPETSGCLRPLKKRNIARSSAWKANERKEEIPQVRDLRPGRASFRPPIADLFFRVPRSTDVGGAMLRTESHAQ